MKKTSVRRGLAWILILVMLLSAVPFGVFAEGAAPQEGTGETPVVLENAGEEKCLCKDRAKCTQEDSNKDCPVCSAEDADLDKCCEGKTPEQLTAEAEAKKAAEEEAAKKAAEEEAAKKAAEEEAAKKAAEEEAAKKAAEEETAKKAAEEEAAKKTAEEEAAKKAAEEEAAKKTAEEEAAKKAAEEEAAKKAAEEEAAKKAAEEEAAKKVAEEAQEASEEAVRNVQEKINALPAADSITAENRGAVEEALTAIDDAKEELTDEEREKLDFTRYDAAVNALYALDGMPGAGVPATPGENSITFTYKEATRPDGFPKTIGKLTPEWNTGVFDGEWSKNNPNVPLPYGTNYVLRGEWSSIKTDNEATRKYLLTLTWGKEEGEQFTEINDSDPACNPIKALTGTADFALQVRGLDQQATWDNNAMVIVVVEENSLRFHCRDSLGPLELRFYVVVYSPATVTFHANAGGANNVTLPDNITSFRTGTVYLREEQKATRPGYIFKGWSTSNGADAAEKMITSHTMNEDNIDLYAVWERVKPTMDGNAIHVDITDGELNAILGENADTLTVKSGAVTDISELLQKLGLDENTAFKAVSVELLRNGDENQKLTELPSTLCFSMDVSGLNLNILQVQRNHNGWGALPRLSAKPTDGQTEGYYLDGNTLYIYSKLFSTFAAYSAPYTVSFDAGDGEVSPKSATTDADGKLSSLPTPTRTGYTFDGWYVKNADGTETKVVEKVTVFTDNAKVYAKWTAWTYTVIFDGNGGKVKNSVNTSETVPAVYGSEVTPPEFVKDYYTVTGWARNANGTEKVESPIKDLAASDGERITLYAQWEYAPRTVTFDANGVDNNGKATKGTVTEEGTEKASVTRKTQESPINTLKTVPVPNAQEGYYFEGWYYKDRANKEQPVEIGKTEFTADTTVYAKWKVFEPVTVTLKCQRGTMTVDGKSVSQGTMQTKWPGVLDGTLPTPARTGYKFQGWYTYAGVKVDENTVFLRDTTIYARWTSAVSRTGNPKTGDQIALEAAVAVLMLAAVGLGAAVIIKKKQNKK